MEVTQSTRTGTNRHRRLVILCLVFISISISVFPEDKVRRETISYENPGDLPLLYPDEIMRQKSMDLYKNPFLYFCFLPGIIVVTIFLFVKKKKPHGLLFLFFIICIVAGAEKIDPGFINKGIQHFINGHYSEALHAFRQAEEETGPMEGLFYNNALCYYHLDKKGFAIFELYKGIKKAPLNSRFRQTRVLMEKEYGLTSQINPEPFIHPDVPFISMLVLFNTTCLLLGLGFRLKKGSIVIAFVLLSLCTIGATAFFITTQVQLREKICVVISREGMLKQIPLPSSRTWVSLKEGTSVKVSGNAKGYYLIKTGRGLKGWIREEDVKVE